MNFVINVQIRLAFTEFAHLLQENGKANFLVVTRIFLYLQDVSCIYKNFLVATEKNL